MRPPSLKTVAKLLIFVGIILVVRYFPTLGPSERNHRHPRHFPRAALQANDPEYVKNNADFIPPLDPRSFMKSGADRDPSLMGMSPVQVQRGIDIVPDGYIPIEFEGRMDTDDRLNVKFCKLNINMYHEDPSETPMFKDLVRKSGCNSGTIITRSLLEVERMPTKLKPSGFVFHQSRVGSTLTANLLGVDRKNLVFSESAPPASVVLHCDGCSESRKIRLLQIIVNAMGNSGSHQRLFFKLQSAQTPYIGLYAQAFPDVPWLYLFRDPVEIMVSHLGKIGEEKKKANCIRSKNRAPREVAAQLSGDPVSVSNAEYCAAHLNYLNQVPLRLLGGASKGLLGGALKGHALDYKDLPGAFTEQVLPMHFHVSVPQDIQELMKKESEKYSKARGGAHEWIPDSEAKHEKAPPEIEKWAGKLMAKSYDALVELSKTPLRNNDEPQDEKVSFDEPNFDKVSLEEFLRPPFEETKRNYLPYPKLEPLTGILERWSPDDPNVPDDPSVHTGSLEVLDYSNLTQRTRAAWLRWNEVPFLLERVPMIKDVSSKWTDQYLIEKFGKIPRKVTYSDTNHFMYFNKRRSEVLKSRGNLESYKEPTQLIDMTFEKWLEHAKEAQNATTVESPHYYLQIGSRPPNDFIGQDLPQFLPPENFFILDKRGNRGINCRFGARAIIAEAHYDGGRNFIAMLRGAKRYVLLPPDECSNLYLYPKSHPEGRHAQADWSQLDISRYPKMNNSLATQVVLKAGQVLYLPSYWFHYIISLGQSAQCNTRKNETLHAHLSTSQQRYTYNLVGVYNVELLKQLNETINR